MKTKLPFPLLESPTHLAACDGWTEEVYRDLMAMQSGETRSMARRTREANSIL